MQKETSNKSGAQCELGSAQ